MKKILIAKVAVIILTFAGPAFAQPHENLKFQKYQNQIAEDSPFATNYFGIPSRVAKVIGITSTEQLIKTIKSGKIPYFEELEIKWARLHPNTFGTFGWSGVDPDHNGEDLDFSKQDALVKLAQENNIHLLAGISPTPTDDEWLTAETYIPENKEAYSSYIRQIVERYDGDGKDDMLHLKFSIKYWQLENEPDLHNRVRKRRGNANFCSPEEYFEVLKLTYQAVKAADKEAKVMLNVVGIGQNMGETSINYLQRLNELGAKNYYDIFSYHVYPDSYNTSILKNILRKFKKLIGDKPIWITESGINSSPRRKLEDASEKNQASWVIKHYIFHLANGVKKIVWLSLTDMNPNVPEQKIAKYSGLLTFRPAKPKLSYYTYKNMVETLEGSDWNNIQTIYEKDGVYVYKLIKNNKSIWVAWNDNNEPKTVRITLDKGIMSVKIAEAVPKHKSGEVMSNDSKVFKEIQGRILATYPMQVQFEIADTPVFVTDRSQ